MFLYVLLIQLTWPLIAQGVICKQLLHYLLTPINGLTAAVVHHIRTSNILTLSQAEAEFFQELG